MDEKAVVKTSTDKLFATQTTDEIIAVMRDEDDDAERARILQKMTPACRKKLKYIETWLRKEVAHTLRSRYELGLQVQELYEDEKRRGGKVYGRNAIGRICKVLRWDDGVIRAALQFVQTYTPEDLDGLCSRVLPKGEPLTWSHVRILLTVDDAAQREELLERTVTAGWTCTDLARRIKNVGQRPGDGRGRPPRVPQDFDGAVAQQQQSAAEWDRWYTRVWAKQDRSLVGQAAKLAEGDVTEERLRQARELAFQLQRVADQAVEQAEKAEAVVRQFERILRERQDQNPASAA